MHPDVRLATCYVRKAQSAADRGIDFDLSFAEYRKLKRTKRCAYTDVLLTPADGPNAKLRDSDLTIDRIDIAKGYVPGNVVACCHAANCIKGTVEAPGRLIGLDKMAMMMERVQKLRGIDA